MFTTHDNDDDMTHSNCGCGHCDAFDEAGYDDEDVYDDPYEVIMYDINAETGDLYALLDMLSDSARSWYASRRLNALAASGPLSALVADIIIDSLGRRWNPLLHPRDRFGRFINTGGFFRWLSNGQWLRGQVTRIDSDGVIHARSLGNDNIPDGSIVKFKANQASKLVSTKSPSASLSLAEINLDAEIPNFPEASPTQRRIYNALQIGDMPAEDLDVYRTGDISDGTPEDFAAEIKGLQDRGLIEIEQGPKPRVRRDDDADLGIINIEDDQIAEVPDDETPDLDDSPNFTKSQRDLLDRIAEADRGEGDGVSEEELGEYDDDDLQALIESGALDVDENGNVYLENPEGAESDIAEPKAETDISNEIFEASKILNDEDAQEAFQHYAEELARPGNENNMPLPEGISAAKRRNAEAAANKWWNERNAGTGDVDAAEEAPTPAPEESKVNPKDVLNPRNQGLADQLLAEYFPDDTFLDSPVGEEYRSALKRLFDAEDLEENGFSAQADAERDRANRAMRRIEVPEEDIAGWPSEVQDARNADREQEPSDVVDDVTPDPNLEEASQEDVEPAPEAAEDVSEPDAPEFDAPEEGFTIETNTRDRWNQYEDRINEEGLADEFYARLEQEARIADELGLDHFSDDAPWSWQNMSEAVGYRVAELMFIDNDGSIGKAGARDIETYERQYENELLKKFNDDPGTLGPEVMRLRKAGLIEPSTGGNEWRLTDAGRERLGLVDELPEGADSLEINTEDLDRVLAEEESLANRADDLAVEEVDLPSERDLAGINEDVPVADDVVDAPDGTSLPDGVWNAEQMDAAIEVIEAMEQAQRGAISRDEAYDVAAEKVRGGILQQQDLDNIQEAARQNLGDDWDPDLEIDFVGDDQRDADGSARDAAVPEFKVASEHPVLDRIKNQKPFDIEAFPDVTEDSQGLVDQDGNPVQIGNWYRARRGGEGDPGELVGFYDQNLYPGWLLVRAPDGKHKAVHVYGRGGRGAAGGMRRISPDELGAELDDWRAQRRAQAGVEVGILDELNAKNKMFDGVPAEVGMRVENRIRGKNDLLGDGDGIVARVVLDKDGNVKVFVLVRGANNERELIEKRVNMLRRKEETPAPPTPATLSEPPGAQAPGTEDLPDREWPVPSDAELIERINEFGGDVNYVKFANAFVNPGVVSDQIGAMLGNQLEIIPGNDGEPPRLRVRDGGQAAPEVDLPDGAENTVEGRILALIDGANDEGLPRSALVNIEDEDFETQFRSITGLVERGVLEKIVDADGRTRFRRVAAEAGPEFPTGAQNELEVDLLSVVDASSRPVSAADLIDLDADDAAEKMAALRSLVDRRVLRKTVDPETGKPVYSRPQSGGSTPVSMSNDEAIRAISSGADPIMVVTDNLEKVLRDAGYDFALNGEAGISADNFWAVGRQEGPFPINIRDGNLPRGQKTRKVNGRVYMVKRSSGSSILPNDVLNEVMAGALSEDLQERLGRDTPGLLYHPRVALASAPKGLGSRAGGAIIMDHAAYGFPEGYEIDDGLKFVGDDLFNGGASEEIIGLGLFDFLINNTKDRHRKNQMYAKDPDTGKVHVVIIDNGFGFGASGSPEGMSFSRYAQMDRPNGLLQRARARAMGRARVRAAVQQFADVYSQMDVESIMDRIKILFPSMSPEQEEYARQHLTVAKTRVELLSTDIDGTVDAIMNI